MRKINHIIIHCSATRAGKNIHLEDIDRWHRQQGWMSCGYHYVIELDGTIRQGRPESQPGAHCLGHNYDSIGVCYVGGLDTSGRPCDTRTPAQKASLLHLLRDLRTRYPDASILAHHDLNSNKDCPCFNVADEYRDM